MKRKPKIGDLVTWHNKVGVVKGTHQIQLEVRWQKPFFATTSWLPRDEVKVISRAWATMNKLLEKV